MRPLQFFSDEYLEQCSKMKPEEILRFLEDFRLLHAPAQGSKSKLISIKIPENLLDAFKSKAKLQEVAYQTQIKVLMKAWVEGTEG